MSLPSGYKRVEFIQSSGTQYIDSGFKPNQDTRVVMDAQIISDPGGSMAIYFGCRGDGHFYELFKAGSGANLTFLYNTSYTKTFTVDYTLRRIVEVNKNIATVDGVSLSYDYAAYQMAYSLYLCADNNAGAVLAPTAMRIYSCQIYDNGTLVRDFIPCINTSNEVGLWDDVNSVFYANAGTGTFTAGPVLEPPEIPTEFETTLAIYLRWTSVADANGYKVYRDNVLIGDTSETYYVDTTAESNQTYTYALTAYNSGGESDRVELIVYTRTGYFIIKPLVTSATFQQTRSRLIHQRFSRSG